MTCFLFSELVDIHAMVDILLEEYVQINTQMGGGAQKQV